MGGWKIKLNFIVTFLTFKNTTMEKKQALDIIKQVIDAAIKRGLFENVESVTAVNTALLVLNEEVKDNDAQ